MRVPNSTYRIQVNADFRLDDVIRQLDYLQQLGISDLYLSPLLQARPGSTHGYDVTDPSRLNADIGTEEDFRRLARELQQRGLGLLLDIVPNHMSATEANPWWRDVMENGPASEYEGHFDIDWESETPGETGRLLLPFLGHELDECIANHELKLSFDHDELELGYFDRRLPIAATALVQLMQTLAQNLGRRIPTAIRAELEDIAVDAVQLPDRRDRSRAQEYRERARELKQRAARAIRQLSATVPVPEICQLTPNQLLVLLEDQPYTLFHWVPGGRQINYRRFFDISDLVGVRVDHPQVFAAMHQRILPWVRNRAVTGLRIDHIDGLRDPVSYLQQLHHSLADGKTPKPYVVVEKILIDDERLPAEWQTAGTTGYDFIGTVNGVFLEPEGWERLGAHYIELGGAEDFTELLHEKKRHVMRSLFPGELRTLTAMLSRLLPDAAHDHIEFTLSELTARLPVYRTYITDTVSTRDRSLIEQSLAGAREHGADKTVVSWLSEVLLEPTSNDRKDFILRWQQFSAPVMAKGLEDTAFYNYHRLVSTCEVGADPRAAVCSIADFHARMSERQKIWPNTMNASSTHDTKRSEDVRARVNVLSELTAEWLEKVERWRQWHFPFKRDFDGLETPDPIDELLLYQTLIGAWPLAENELDDFTERICNYMIKAVREAKRRTSWRAQNPEYEKAVTDFTDAVLDPENHRFHDDLLTLLHRTEFFGALNSLSQLVLKLGAPGLPDIYQGNELWTFALVDPDNRRSVDFDRRRASLVDGDVHDLKANWRDGRLKFHFTRHGLQMRNRHPDLFSRGEYVPVIAKGQRARNVIAFERVVPGQRALFIGGRFFSELCAPEEWPDEGWCDTTLDVRSGEWHNLITGEHVTAADLTPVASLLSGLPAAFLLRSD